jgi:hypothetical protein
MSEEVSRDTVSVAGDGRLREHRLSALLRKIGGDTSRDRISIQDLLEAMGDRAYGALLLIFALPNVLPTPPGTSSVLGAPLIFLALQLAAARPTPWLPKLIASRAIAREDFVKLVGRAAPWISRAERLLGPRLEFLTAPLVERLIGVLCVLLSIVLFLPIPLGNMLPALAICLFALGILERDGLALCLGLLTTALSAAVVWGVVLVFVKSALFVVTNALSL